MKRKQRMLKMMMKRLKIQKQSKPMLIKPITQIIKTLMIKKKPKRMLHLRVKIIQINQKNQRKINQITKMRIKMSQKTKIHKSNKSKRTREIKMTKMKRRKLYRFQRRINVELRKLPNSKQK